MVAALYQLALRSSRRVAWTAAVICGACSWAASAIHAPADLWTLPALSSFAWAGLAAAYGDSVRNRRAYVAEVEDRARRAEQSREDEAHRRVAEERLRIARELHDVVAHHMAVINVQAGAAAFALSRQPAAAELPLNHIRRASSVVLKELAAIVGLLRQPGDVEAGGGRLGNGELGNGEPGDGKPGDGKPGDGKPGDGKPGDGEPVHPPQPGLDRLPELLGQFHGAGVDVQFEQVGEARPLPAAGNLAAYRITQEALTNARKHGDGGPVRVRFAYDRDRLQVEVINGVGRESAAESGYGLIGMRERAAAAGGSVHAARTGNDDFTVHATLPAPRPDEEQP
jgi:signal transduction histidine kinase